MRRSFLLHVALNGVYNGDDEFMAGESLMYSGTEDTIPAGWLVEDGSEVGRVAYASLFAKIGTIYGAGDGANTFNLPDSRGEVWRGLDMGRGVDAGRELGSAQGHALQGHSHELTYPFTGRVGGDLMAALSTLSSSGIYRNEAGTIKTNGVHGVPQVAEETRMRNIAKIPLIKYS